MQFMDFLELIDIFFRYSNISTSAPGTAYNYPAWMQSAYSSLNQQQATAAGSYQRFGFNSAPTQPKNSSNSLASTVDQSSAETLSSSSNFRPSYRPPSHRGALLGDRPPGRARPGLGYAAGTPGGAIRFELGRPRGGIAQNRFSNVGAGIGSSENGESGGGDDKSAKPSGMPDAMK